LEKKLSYEDIRYYRSIARSQLRKDLASRRKLEEEKKKEQPKQAQGWGAWLWGSSQSAAPTEDHDPLFGGPMTEQQRKELYTALDMDDRDEMTDALQAPRDALNARVHAKLNKGSLTLKGDPHGQPKDIISVVFDAFQADVIQRPDNLETSVSLGGFRVFDGTTTNTLYSQIVHVKDRGVDSEGANTDPFFFLKFENNPLDERADTALTVRMRYMEIIYHKGYVEAIYQFFKPPASQLESVEALLDVASQTLEGIRRDTRAGLEYALQTHKTVDVQMDLNAPIIIIPEECVGCL
jgi:vacuolar protein sorting-associated protein 13A/C